MCPIHARSSQSCQRVHPGKDWQKEEGNFSTAEPRGEAEETTSHSLLGHRQPHRDRPLRPTCPGILLQAPHTCAGMGLGGGSVGKDLLATHEDLSSAPSTRVKSWACPPQPGLTTCLYTHARKCTCTHIHIQTHARVCTHMHTISSNHVMACETHILPPGQRQWRRLLAEWESITFSSENGRMNIREAQAPGPFAIVNSRNSISG